MDAEDVTPSIQGTVLPCGGGARDILLGDGRAGGWLEPAISAFRFSLDAASLLRWLKTKAARDAGLTEEIPEGRRDRTFLEPLARAFRVSVKAEALGRWFGAAAMDAFGEDTDAIRQALDRDILEIDRLIAAQLDAILHHPALQALEGRWRGLRWLVERIEDGPGDRVLVRVLNMSWREIARDVERSDDFDQSELFRLIHESEFGMAGGEPFGLLLIDHAVRHGSSHHYPFDDVSVLRHLAAVALLAFVPVVVGAAPELLEVESFATLGAVNDPAAPFRNPDHANWRKLRDNPDSRFLAVALPRVLARAPWTDDGARGDGLRYRERAATPAERVWMNAGYAFAAVAARAAAQFGWPADVRGADPDRMGGGLVTDPPRDPHRLSQTLILPRLPLEVVFTDRQERFLIEAGLMPLGALPHGGELLFGAVRTLHQPPRPAGPAGAAAFADSRIATQINAVLCVSRFAHYLKIRGRDAVGRLLRPEDVEQDLRRWLAGFVNRNTMATAETRASHPLFDAAVRVAEHPYKPGVLNCSVTLQPYFQLDNVTASFDFETELVPPRR